MNKMTTIKCLGIVAVCATSLCMARGELKDDLVSYWPLDEIQGSKTPDLVSGYDMDIFNLSSESIVEGRFGSAFSFENAKNTLLARVHSPGENLPINQFSSFTISMWVNITGAGQTDLRVFSEGSTVDNNPLFNIGTHNGAADGTVDLFIRNDTGGWPLVNHLHSTTEAFDGVWRHLVYREEAGVRTLHIDGVLDSLEIAARPGTGVFPANNTSIGGIQRSVQSHWVTGLIDDVAIWKRALTDEEITELSQNGMVSIFPEVARGLIAHWPMEVIQGSKTPDVVSGYDMDVFNLTEGDIVDGKSGKAFSFVNARNTLLSRVHNQGEKLPVNQHDSYTISMWVNVVGTGQTDLRVFSEGSTVDNNPLFNIGTHNGAADGTVDLFIRNDTGGWPLVNHLHSTSEAFDGEWRHLVYREDAGVRSIYIDGVLDALEIPARPETGSFPANNTSIGGIQRSVQSHWVTGLIDEVAIWNRALTEDEIIGIRDNGVPETIAPPPAPLEIRTFQAEFTSVVSGGKVKLSWDVNADAQIDIQPGLGNVNGNSQFGVGSVEATVTEDTTFTLTISRGADSQSAQARVVVRTGVASGWVLLEDFEGLSAGRVNGQGRWLNAEGRADVIDLGDNKVLSPMGNTVLSNIKLGSYEVNEGTKATLFFRVYADDAFSPYGVNVGLTEKTLRFASDATSNVGPYIRLNKAEGFQLGQIQARNGVGGAFDSFFDLELDSAIIYNVWVDISNDPIETGDLYSVYIARNGEERVLAFQEFLTDRDPAGSQDLGAVKPNLTDLMVVAGGGTTTGGVLFVDDFYLSLNGYLSSVPVAPQSFVRSQSGGGEIGELRITDGSFDSANNRISLTFTSVVGATYKVLSKSVLTNDQWVEAVTGIAGQAGTTTVVVQNVTDDTSFFLISGSAPPAGPSALFFDDFENGKGSWTTGATFGDDQWELGAPQKPGISGAFSGSNAWATQLTRNYLNDSTSYLRTPVIDLTTVTSATFSFQTCFDVETGIDTLAVRILDQDGNEINDESGFPVPELIDFIFMTGTSGEGWKKVSKPLPAAAFGRSVIIEFLITADSSENGPGWFVDDVALR